ncbi:MAG: FAD-binding protein [Gemmatimonadales bacterium]|nr:FAD-binding protein [Gemmatimonadales bacterium]
MRDTCRIKRRDAVPVPRSRSSDYHPALTDSPGKVGVTARTMPDSIAETEPLDVIIVGAGPCGLAVAIAVRERGLSYAILDRGCITESLTRYPSYMTFFSTAELLEIGGVPFTIPEPKPTRRDALAYYRKVVSHHRIDVRQYEEVTAIRREADAFTLDTRTRDGRERRIASRAVVIATGGFGAPNRLEFEGDSPHDRIVHYYR